MVTSSSFHWDSAIAAAFTTRVIAHGIDGQKAHPGGAGIFKARVQENAALPTPDAPLIRQWISSVSTTRSFAATAENDALVCGGEHDRRRDDESLHLPVHGKLLPYLISCDTIKGNVLRITARKKAVRRYEIRISSGRHVAGVSSII